MITICLKKVISYLPKITISSVVIAAKAAASIAPMDMIQKLVI
mgnify:CR=1